VCPCKANNKNKKAQANCMRFTAIICTLNLILLGSLCGAYAFIGAEAACFALIKFEFIWRVYFAICAVSALFVLYVLIYRFK